MAIYRQLKQLIDQGTLQKVGKPPLVFYVLAPKVQNEIVKDKYLRLKPVSAVGTNFVHEKIFYLNDLWMTLWISKY